MREGKNREIRNVLGALGLQVNRLIRVSFGPFQLGELPDGAVEEVKTRALREQLGARLAALPGADFSAADRGAGGAAQAPTLPATRRREAQRASQGRRPGAARSVERADRDRRRSSRSPAGAKGDGRSTSG